MDLNEACASWQSGRDGGSSRLRGAARVLTGIDHYFDAQYIRDLERDAESHEPTMDRAHLLLDAIANSQARSAEGWCVSGDAPVSAFAGRGLASKDEDDLVLAALQHGEVEMPLWGMSLDRKVAASYGGKFMLEIEGLFHGVAAWRESGVKENEREIITGGRYAVDRPRKRAGTFHVTLREVGQLWPPRSAGGSGRATTRLGG